MSSFYFVHLLLNFTVDDVEILLFNIRWVAEKQRGIVVKVFDSGGKGPWFNSR